MRLIGVSGLIFLGLFFRVVIVFCIVVKLIIVGMLVKFCIKMCVG